MPDLLNTGDVINEFYTIIKVLYSGRLYNFYLITDKRSPETRYQLTEFLLDHIPPKKGPFKEEDFLSEVDLLREIQHPLLPSLVDGFFYQGKAYLVLTHSEGISLEQYLAMNVSPFTVEESIKRIKQLVEALKYLYNRPEPLPFIHIEPSHISISENGEMTLTGFGLHLFLDHYLSSTNANAFCAPEIAEGHHFAVTSAVYTLGTLLYYFVTKKKWNSDSKTNLHLRELDKSIPDRYEQLAEISLNKKPERRILDLDNFERKLDEVLNPPSTEVKAESSALTRVAGFFEKEIKALKRRLAIVVFAILGLFAASVIFLIADNAQQKGREFSDGLAGFVLCDKGKSVHRVDLKSDQVSRKMTFTAEIRAMAPSYDGMRLFLLAGERDIFEVDAHSGKSLGAYSVEGSPDGLLLEPAGPLAYLKNKSDPFITVWNTQTHEVSYEIPSGEPQISLAVSSTGEIIYMLGEKKKEAASIDAKNLQFISTFPVEKDSVSCAVNKSGNCLIVLTDDEIVYLYDSAGQSPVKQVFVAGGRKYVAVPHGPEAGDCAYIACESGNLLFAVDIPSVSVVKRVSTRSAPKDIRISNNGRLLYVLTSSPGGISVFDAGDLALKKEINCDCREPESLEVWP
ncbi:MAG: protein kinase [Vulcanimicrobiota bacterium]